VQADVTSDIKIAGNLNVTLESSGELASLSEDTDALRTGPDPDDTTAFADALG